jgi:dTMP kinase
MKSRRGRFLVLEGLDGAGTTTQASRLCAWLSARGRTVHLTSEPSRGPLGTGIRQVLSGRLRGAGGGEFDPGALALLFAADRLDHWESEIRPRLAEGQDVVSDRYVLSGRLRGAGGGEFDPGALALLFAADRLDHWESEIRPRLEEGIDVVSDRYVLSSLAYQAVATGDPSWVAAVNARAPAPDLTVFLRVRPAVALRRRYAATTEREIFEVPGFQRRVHRAYGRALARLVEAGERVVVLRGEQPVERVADEVAAAVERLES